MDMELREYFLLLRKWLWLLLIGAILGGAGAFIASYYQTPVYQAQAQVLVSQPPRDELTDLGYLSGQQLIQTYARLMLTDQTLTETGDRLGYHINAEAITVSQIRDTLILSVIVEDNSPYSAALFANMLIEIFAEQQYNIQTSRYAETKISLETNLEKQRLLVEENEQALEAVPNIEENEDERNRLGYSLSQSRETYATYLEKYEGIRIAEAQSFSLLATVDAAKPNLIPVRPLTVNNTILGAVVGLMLSGGIAFLIEYLDDTVKIIDDITRKIDADITMIGQITKIKELRSKDYKGVFVKNNPRSPVAESFRALRTNLEFANASSPVKTLLVTSPGPGEGKSTVLVNLAMALKMGGKRVGVIDCDLRRPTIHKLFNIRNGMGLSEYFRGRVNHIDIIQMVEENLFVVTSGKLPPNPAELLTSDKMFEFIEKFSTVVDIILMDTPPTMLTDPIALSARVDGAILIVEPRTTKIGAAQSALERLQQANARVLGVVFNKVPRKLAKNYHYYYADHYQAEEETSMPTTRNGRKPRRNAQT